MNDREKATSSSVGTKVPIMPEYQEQDSTLWMKDTICSFEGTKKSTGNIV